VQSRSRLDGSGRPTTFTDPPEGNAPLKRNTPPASWIPKKPVVVQAALPQAKYENTVPGGWINGLVVKEYAPGLVLLTEKYIPAKMGLLDNVLRLNDGVFWGGVTVNDDPSGPAVLTKRDPAT